MSKLNAATGMFRERKVSEIAQMWDTEDILAMLACVKTETWLARVLVNEMKSRGLDWKGEWVGFAQANRVWRDYD